MTPVFPGMTLCLLCLLYFSTTDSAATVNTEKNNNLAATEIEEGQFTHFLPQSEKYEARDGKLSERDEFSSDTVLEPEEGQILKASEKRSWPDTVSSYDYILRHMSPVFYKPRGTRFLRIVRGRLGRMPIAYGKRAMRTERELSPYTKPEKVQIEETFGKTSQEDLTDAENGGKPLGFTRLARQRLNRMPLSFGKRASLQSSEDMKSFLMPRDTRGKLNRMPLSFGKRADEAGLSADSSDLDEEDDQIFHRVAKARIHRMPISFGKRNLESLERDQRSKLGRMPLTFGKRDGEEEGQWRVLLKQSGSIADENSSDVERRSKLHRMPLTFGKRGRLGRMPISFGKRGSSVLLDGGSDSGEQLIELPPGENSQV